jgi:hypothetical protein
MDEVIPFFLFLLLTRGLVGSDDGLLVWCLGTPIYYRHIMHAVPPYLSL